MEAIARLGYADAESRRFCSPNLVPECTNVLFELVIIMYSIEIDKNRRPWLSDFNSSTKELRYKNPYESRMGAVDDLNTTIIIIIILVIRGIPSWDSNVWGSEPEVWSNQGRVREKKRARRQTQIDFPIVDDGAEKFHISLFVELYLI